MPKQGSRLYECGPFLLDPLNHVLSRDGSPLPLPPKAFDTLLVLVEHRGNLVEKEQLLKAVWPDTFVEENNLTQYISLLRRVLGDNPEQRQYIETVPRLGYRFVAPVREVKTGESEDPPVRNLPVEPSTGPEKRAADEQARQVEAPLSPTIARAQSKLFPFALVALAIIVGAGWIAYKLWSRAPTSAASSAAIRPRRTVAVLGFKNLAANPEADWLSTALVEMLNSELSTGARLRAVSGEDVARARSDLKITDSSTHSKNTLTQVRRNLGADITVSGSFLELGAGAERQIRLDIEVQDTVAGETIGSIAEVGTVSNLFQLISQSGRQLRAKLGASEASSMEEGEIRAALPSTPEAARFYSEGLSRLREFDAPAAQTLLAKALAIDPNYALGHSALAAAWSALGYDEKAKAEAARAFELSRNLSREEHLLVTGRYREMNREWDKAVETYQLLFNSFPDNLEYGIRLMDAQTSAGRGKDALATADRLRKLAPPSNEDPRIDLAEAKAQQSQGAFKEELQSAENAARKGEALGENLLVAQALVEQSWACSRLGQPANATRDLEQAKDLFRAAGDQQGVASTAKNTANILLSNGDYARAHAAAEQALQTFEHIGDQRGLAQSLNTLATIDYQQGNLPRAKQLYERSLQVQREVGSKANIAGALGNIANILDAEGDLSQAQKLTEDSIQVFTEIGDRRALATALGNLAELLEEQGELPRARKTYEDALKITREIGYQRGTAYDLAGLSEVSAAEGNLPDASKQQEEALAIRTAIGEKHNAAASLWALSELALDQGNSPEAETFAVRAAELLSGEKSGADEAAGDIVLAQCFAAQGKLTDAQNALKRAAVLSRGNVSRALHFELAIATAEVKVAEAKQANPGSALEAERMLKAALQEAHRCGSLGYEFRLRLAWGELEAKYGQPASGRLTLQQLIQDSKAKGFNSVSRRAETLLAASTAQR